MANVKITELTAATTLDGDDVFPVVDVSGDTTNKVSVTDLLRNVPDGTAAAPSIANTGDQDTGILFPAADTVAISTGGTQRFSVDGSGDVSISGSLTVSGTTTTIESTTLTVDDKNIELGSVATPTDTTADGGGITLKGATDKEIKWVNSTGYWTLNTGIEIGGHLQIDDNNEIRVGTSQDLKIYHDGSNSYIDEAGTGELRIRVADTAGSGFYKYSNNEKLATFQPDGAVTLYYNNVAKLATKSDGIDVTGEVQCDSLDVDGAGDISGNLTVDSGTLFVDSSNNRVGIGTTSPGSILHISASDAAVVIQDSDGSGNAATPRIQFKDSGGGTAHGEIGYTGSSDSNLSINNKENAATVFSTNNTERMRIDSSGDLCFGSTVGANNDGSGISIYNASNPRLSFRNSTTGNTTSDGSQLYLVNSDLYVTNNENANLILRTNSTERMRIDSSGRLLVGTSTSVAPNRAFQIAGTATMSICANENSVNGVTVDYIKSRNTTYGSNTIVQDGDSIAKIQFRADDGGDYLTQAAQIAAEVDGTPGSNDMPGRLTFLTTADGASTPTERMRIDSSGNIGIGQSSPASALHVSGTSVARLQLSTDSTGHTATDGVRIQVDSGNNFELIQRESANIEVFIAGTERLRIDSSGNVGIGTSSPAAKLELRDNSQALLSWGDTAAIGSLSFDGSSQPVVRALSGKSLVFQTNGGNERMRIDSSGRVGIGTSSLNTNTVLSVHKGDSSESQMRFTNSTTGEAGNNGFLVGIDSSEGGRLFVQENNYLRFGTNNTERMRITSGGDLLFGKTGDNFGTAGAKQKSTGALELTADGAFGLAINRLTDDGELVRFYQATTQEGSITVSGTTVSYNGAHLSRWSQLASGAERTEILRGSVLSNLDEMCEWGDENNEQLNRMQVSDVEGDVNVAGVFQAWDDDDDTYTNDFYCAMTGDFVIRIAQGTTVTRGDLLMSAGDGTAKPQDDDIVRSKTIAKVTSTTVSATYADGSYCVPCVLMAC